MENLSAPASGGMFNPRPSSPDAIPLGPNYGLGFDVQFPVWEVAATAAREPSDGSNPSISMPSFPPTE